MPGSKGSPLEKALKPASYGYFELIDRLRVTLQNGVTTARDLMGIDTGVRDAVADVIKVASSGGVSSPNDDPTWLGMRREMIAAVVEEGHNYGGRPVAAHAIGNAGIKAAVEAGVRSVEHGYELDDELRPQMVAQGTFLVPTLLETMKPVTATPQGAAKSANWHALAHDSIAASAAAGVKIALGVPMPASRPTTAPTWRSSVCWPSSAG